MPKDPKCWLWSVVKWTDHFTTDSRISTLRSSVRQIFTIDPPDTTASRESATFGSCGGHYVAGCDLDHEPGIHVAVAWISIGVPENARAMARWCIRCAKRTYKKVKSRRKNRYRKWITHRNTRSTKTFQNAINTETTRHHYSPIITQCVYLNSILPGTYL